MPGFVDFRLASTVATEDATAIGTSPRRWPRSPRWPDPIGRSPPHSVSFRPTRWSSALPFLQRAALDPAASKALRGKKAMLNAVREQGAVATGVEVPKLIEPRRVSWVTLVLVVGTLIGGWALIGGAGQRDQVVEHHHRRRLVWVAATFVLAQAAYPAIAITTVGSVTNPLPYGRTLALEVSDTFVPWPVDPWPCWPPGSGSSSKRGSPRPWRSAPAYW